MAHTPEGAHSGQVLGSFIHIVDSIDCTLRCGVGGWGELLLWCLWGGVGFVLMCFFLCACAFDGVGLCLWVHVCVAVHEYAHIVCTHCMHTLYAQTHPNTPTHTNTNPLHQYSTVNTGEENPAELCTTWERDFHIYTSKTYIGLAIKALQQVVCVLLLALLLYTPHTQRTPPLPHTPPPHPTHPPTFPHRACSQRMAYTR